MQNNNSLATIDQNPPENHAASAVEQSRAIQEVQAMVIMAKKYPRDETACYNKIIQSCKRASLAQSAMYSYPKGGQQVTGASIRMAETLAKYWGNIEFGIVELSQKDGVSEIMSYAWDLESNTRQVKKFHVKHTRYSKSKGNTKLSDPRDIYEMTANQGARRLRACILGILPGDVIDSAVSECEKTLRGDNKEPIADKIKRCVAQFTQIGVTQKMLEKRLLHSMEATNLHELVTLGKVFNSIKDNMSSIKDNFPDDVDDKIDKQMGSSEPKKLFNNEKKEETKELTEEEKAEIAKTEEDEAAKES